MQIELKDKQQKVQLVQITDSHLGSQPNEPLVGMDTDVSLAHVVKLVAKERSSIDLLLATGDISNSGSVSSYQRFRHVTRPLARHALWLPGNHDTADAMLQGIEGGEELSRSAVMGNWQILMLDSTTEGEVGGCFTQKELDFLKQSLNASAKNIQNNPVKHVLICLHHHPVNIGCAWLDEQKVANADDFFAILDQFEHVRGVLWGHIHQSIDRERHGVRLMATPSSCVQFAPNSPHFKLDQLNPGYRWLELHADGCINSGVSRVTGVHFDLDYEDSTGY